MKKAKISDAETVILILQDEIRRSYEARYDHRLHAVLMVAQGQSCNKVSQLLGDPPRAVAYWVSRFETEGLSGLADADRPGRPSKLDEHQLKIIETALRSHPSPYGLEGNLWDGKMLSHFIAKQFGVELGVRQCQRLFRRLGFRLRKPRPIIAKADPEKQEDFKKIAEYAASRNIDLWSTNEVHFQQHGSRCQMWIPPECKDPIVLHFPTRKSVGYFGAIRLCDGKLVCQRETNSFNAQSYWKFMKKLCQISCHTGRRVLVLADNARYHHANLHAHCRGQCSDRFSQLFLPPYSLDLNPIERVWKLTRRLATHNRYFETIEQVVDAVESQFKLWSKPNSTLKKICAII